ncbi:MAG: glycosyltransferase, group 1 family protein [Patescibacteria group bacterium]|nr:glycosyltransferase, group 1 family protein [Patescibacteria group bacterium]
MATIAFLHNALGKTDGVSLEVDKWRYVLETKMKHNVLYCAGNDDVSHVHCVPELSFMHPRSEKILRNATVQLKDFTETELKEEIFKLKDIIKTKLLAFIRKHKIDLLIPNNLLSVGYHIPALIALHEIITETKIPTIAHNHDFYFEASGEVNPTCKTVWNLLDLYTPVRGKNVQNITINRIAQAELFARTGVKAQVVPNVFDFKQPAWKEDAYNADFRKSFDIGENDIVLLQATRIMLRKGIENAIDIVAEMNTPENRRRLLERKLYNGKQFTKDSRIILLCAGRREIFGTTDTYYNGLLDRAKRQNVAIRFAGEYVKHSRGKKNGKKVYSLWDSYVHSDFVSYPSWWEGWGNQLIEAVFARLPVVLYEYPVYKSDIARSHLEVVSLGDKISSIDKNGLVSIDRAIVQRAAAEIVSILTDPARYSHITEKNFRICAKRYSYEVLEALIRKIMKKIGM